MPDIAITLAPEAPHHAPAIEGLHERAFGPGRFARTAFRLREGREPEPDLSFVAGIGAMLVGSNRLTRIVIGGRPGLLLGPLTVEPAFHRRGIGALLMAASLEAAGRAGHELVLLVGDEPYYGRFGFRRVPPGQLTLPGPVDPQRVLVREGRPGALEGVSGAVLPMA